MQTPEQFRSLAASVLAARKPAPDEPALEIVQAVLDEPEEIDEPVDEPADDELDLVRDLRLFHARVIEAVEAAVETLVTDIAADVLGRELLLAPVDIEAIVDSALQRFAAEEPLRVRVHAEDAASMRCAIPVVTDMRLRRGDAVIELRDGSADTSLGVRLATLVRSVLA